MPGPRAEIDDLALAERIDGGDPAIALEHIGPFGGIGVPVQLAQGAGLQRQHRKAVTFASLAVPLLNCSVFCAPSG